MEGVFDHLQFWHWWILAIIFLILEMLSPGVFFMWIGLAAGATGVVLLAMPELGWEIQFVIFALTSILAVIAGKFWFKRHPITSEQPDLNERSEDLIGKTYQVEQAIKNGAGRIKVGESTWKATGPDCPAGSLIRVVSVDGAVVTVEPV